MKRRLILHIGAHRTATTSQQNYLFKNRDAAAELGFLYPFGVRRHMQFFNALFSGEMRLKEALHKLETAAESQSHSIHTVILSDEDLSMRKDLSLLKGLRDRFDVKVVFSMRRQDLWLESWFQQNTKWQWNPELSHIDFASFMRTRKAFHWIDYDRHIRGVEKVFGADSVLPIVYERGQMRDGPVAEFCDRIGITDRAQFLNDDHMNPSFSSEMSEFVRRLPFDKARPGLRNALIQACMQVDKKVLGNTNKRSALLIPHDERRAVMAEFAESNRAVASRFFDRTELFNDPLPDLDEPLARMAIPTDGEELMENFIIPLIEEYIRNDNQERARKKAAG